MAQSYTAADVNQISNQYGEISVRPYGSSGAYSEAIFTNDVSITYSPEKFTQDFGSTGDVFDVVSKEVGEVTFGYGKVFDQEFMTLLSGGLFTKTMVTAGPKACDDQTIAADWTDKDPIVIVLKDGSTYYKADGEPAITSVTASSVGVLAVNDDYTIISDVNSSTGFSIVLNTAGSAGVSTTESVVIVFNTPDVVGTSTMTVGGIKNYDALEGKIVTAMKDGTPVVIYFHKGYYDGNIKINTGSVNTPDAIVTDVVISLKNDTSRSTGDEMFSIVEG